MSERRVGQIIFNGEARPGVAFQREFKTEAEARAYVIGAIDMLEQADPDQEFSAEFTASTAEFPAEDE